jgi:hypothetical protein
MRAVLSVIAGLLLVSSAAAAQSKSIAGTWNATVTMANGGGNPTLTFTVKGDSVTGTVKRPATGESFPLTGTIKGKDLTYRYTVTVDGKPMLVTVKAKVAGDSLSGTMDFGGQGTGQIRAARAPASAPKK